MEGKFKPKTPVGDSAVEGLAKLHEQLMCFGHFLVASRKVLNQEPEDIAAELDLESVESVRNWENGTSFPKEKSWPKVAEAYRVLIEEFLEKLRISKMARKREIEMKRGALPVSRKPRPDRHVDHLEPNSPGYDPGYGLRRKK